ncbi:MAG: glycosyltransferase family 1 protein, partial [Bacteroidota bacterium]
RAGPGLPRIGIDARWLFSGNPSGRVWVREVTRALVEQYPHHAYVLFHRPSEVARPLPFDVAPPTQVTRVPVRSLTGLGTALWSLPAAANRAEVDVLVTQYYAAPRVRAHQITVVHDVLFESKPDYFSRRQRLYFRPMRRMLRAADTIVTVSTYVTHDLKRYGYVQPHQSLAVVPNGINPAFAKVTAQDVVAVRERYQLPEAFLLYVGRLNVRKNIDGLLTAVSEMRHQEAPLLLAGSAEGRTFDPRAYIEALGLHDRVRLLGFVPDKDLPALYGAARAFAYVSHAEGFGLPPVEAMAAGTPVVVSNTTSLPEVCGDAALYVSPTDQSAIARALDRVWDDLPLRHRLTKAGRARATQFSWTRTADLLMRLVPGHENASMQDDPRAPNTPSSLFSA